MARHSISRRLMAVLTITVGLSSALVVLLLFAYQTRAAEAAIDEELQSSVSSFATLIEPALWDIDFARAARVANAYLGDPRIARLTVHEASTDSTQVFESAPATDTVVRVREVKRGDQPLGTVSVAFRRGYFREQVLRQVLSAAAASLLALAVTLVGLWVLLRLFFRRPILQLSDVVRGYVSGQAPPFASVVPYEEFAELGRVLDSMSGQIREQVAALRAANRELAALNRLLGTAAADLPPAQLVAEAARELQELFAASRVHADFDAEQVAPKQVYSSVIQTAGEGQVASLTVPLVVGEHPTGAISIARELDRPFTDAEVKLAHAVAAQLAAAVSRYQARAAERLLRVAIEQLPESVVITDGEERIVYVNSGFTATTGYTAAEALGRSPRDLIAGTRDDATEQAIRGTLRAGRPWIGRLTNKKKSGETFFEQTLITPVRDERGEVTNHVSIGRDVTVEMKRDEQFRHAQRLDAVGQLAGGVAHDFNNLLGAALMQIELVEHEEPVTPSLQQTLDEMRGALERAANLTRQLLVFSRRQAMRVDTHDLNSIVAEMLRILTRVIGERVEIAFAPAPRPVRFEGDAGMIEQVLVNLCVNARDAMRDGGRIDIATGVTTLGPESEHPGVWACLEVKDTGTGMTPEVQARAFEPFFTTKEVGQGTGLGLATTHGIVMQHGGWITVESTVGKGTTFRVHLPALAGAALAPAAEPPRDVVRGNATVLVVEDEPLVRHTVSHSLQRLGHRVVEATNGREALDVWKVRQGEIDLVITDMVMPGGMSGVQLVERLRELTPAVRAIVMSGYSVELTGDALPAGISFLAKPFSLAQLTGTIQEALNGGRPER